MRHQSRLQFRSMFRVKVSNPTTNALIGYVADVSENGLRLLSDTRFSQGTRMPVRLRMKVKEGEVLQFDLDITCMWTGSNAKTGYYEAGFMVNKTSPEFTLMVERMRIQRNETETSAQQ
jgi:hypothetical protein